MQQKNGTRKGPVFHVHKLAGSGVYEGMQSGLLLILRRALQAFGISLALLLTLLISDPIRHRDLEKESVEVYSAFLQHNPTLAATARESILIEKTTIYTSQRSPSWKRFSLFEWFAIIDYYSHRAEPPLSLPESLPLQGRYVVCGLSECNHIYDDHFLEREKRRVDPNATIIRGPFFFSRVGFNATGDRAFFYYSNACPLCGSGGYVLMEKIDGKWTFVKGENIWIS